MKTITLYLSTFASIVSGGVLAQSACLSSHLDFAYEGSSNAQCIEKGDFTGDGILDIVEGNFTLGANKIYFIKGLPGGKFDVPVPVDVTQRPLDIKAYDFNQDGKLDIAVANQLDALLAISFGNGDGTFQAPTTFNTNTSPNDIALGDINKDGAMDIVVSCLSGGFELLLGSVATPGTFPTQNYFTAGSGARGIAVADFNQDGNPDVATANNTTGNIAVLNGDGLGGFSAPVMLPAQTATFQIAVGNFDGNAYPDIAVTNETANSVTIVLNGSTGFSPSTNIPVGSKPNGIKIGDFNNDTKQDLAVVSFSANEFSVFLGNGSGTFSFPNVYVGIGTPRDLVVYDCNGDGKQDAVVSTNIGAVMPVFYGNGDGTFMSVKNTFPVGTGAKNLDHADFNGDGNQDIVVANSADQTVSLHLGNGMGVFNYSGDYSTDILPLDLVTGDVNMDGKQDVVTVNNTSETISVLLGNGAGSFAPATNFPCGSTPTNLAMGDVNGDGKQDIVVLNNSTQQFSVLIGNGTGGFAAPVSYTSGNNATGIILAKFNGDAALDVGFTTRGNSKFGRSLNSGTGTFGAVAFYNVGNAPTGLDFGDFNNDGFTDIAIANFNTNNFTRLLGNGTGAFSPPISITAPDSGPAGVVVSDFNGDGFDDILGSCANGTATTGYAPILMGVGNGTFNFTEHFATEIGSNGIITTDFNNDGLPDIAVVNEVSKNVTVLFNKTPIITADGPTSFCSTDGVNLISSPAPNYLWSSGETTQLITPTVSGTYSVTTTSGYSGQCTSASNEITVTVEQSPILTLTNDLTICAGQSTNLTVSGASTYVWSDGLGTGTTVTVNPSATKTYYVTGDGGTGCTTLDSVVVTVVSAPDATFNTLNAGYCQNAAPVNLVPVQGGGVFSGSGVSGSTFSPSIAPVGSVTVTYTIDLGGGCIGTTNQVTQVNPIPNATFSGLQSTYCINSASSGLNPMQVGGVFSGTGVSGSQFSPSTAGIGTHNVTYSITNGFGCLNTSVQSTTVNGLPDGSFTGLDPIYCGNNTNYPLTGTVPGGVFSGPGISGNNFNPSLANVGSNTITYTATDLNGCSNSTSQSTTVEQAPSANFIGLQTDYCIDAASVTLTPDVSGGVFSGNGVAGNTFSPGAAGIGIHFITYDIDNGSGCTNYLTLETEVHDYSSAAFTGLLVEYCAININEELLPDTPGGTFSGPGVSGNFFNPENAGQGTHTIVYLVTDQFGCTSSTSQSVNVVPAASAFYSGLNQDYCINSAPANLVPQNAGGSFSGTGVSGSQFDPATAGVGIFIVTYTIVDGNGCTNTYSDDVEVHSLPVVSFTGLSNTYCQTDAATNLIGSPSGGVFSGPGINGTQFNPMLSPTGTVTVIYNYSDVFGCSGSSQQNTMVNVIDDASFNTLNSQYCTNDPSVTLVPAVSGGTFSGTSGVVGNVFYPTFGTPGLVTVSYEIISIDGCVSNTDQTVNLYSTPNPAVTLANSTLTATASGAGITYQWVNCSDFLPIDGAINQSYTPLTDGSYAVQVSNGNCDIFSDCINVFVGLDEQSLATFNYYPNPTSGKVTIEMDEQAVMQLVDMNGKVIYKQLLIEGTNKLDFTALVEPGVYRIQVNGRRDYKNVPLVIMK